MDMYGILFRINVVVVVGIFIYGTELLAKNHLSLLCFSLVHCYIEGRYV